MITTERYRGEADEWNAFVAAHPSATHCHRYGWRRVIEATYGHDCPYLCARDGEGRLAGVLPLADVRTPLIGRFLVSLPYLNYGGALGTEEAVRALTDRALLLARETGARLELRAAPPAGTGLRRVDEKITCVLPLEGDAAAVWRRLPAKVRSQVRRPEKAGATVRSGPAEADAFHQVFARVMRDLGTPAHPLAFFRAVAAALGEDAWFVTVRMGERPVAAGCAIRFGARVELVWAGALRLPAAPNMLLYWSVIERAAAAGADRFDFGRCTPGGGTHRFKQQWGAVDVPLPWARAAEAVASAPSQTRGLFGLGSRLWRRLPVRVATPLGARLRGAFPA